jgi:cyclopropane fatty-acyl-phospholipid synthase-like methyltransferase
MAQEDKERWDKKYRNNPIPDQPVPVVTEFAKLAKGRKALDIACGMGRNSKYLASMGFEVDALDISSVAIDSLQGIPNIHPKEVDLDSYTLPENRYDLIISTNFLKRALFPQIRAALKEGGLFIYETFLYHPDNETAPSNRSFLLEEGELKSTFSHGYSILHLREYWTEDLKGAKTMKASIVARKM